MMSSLPSTQAEIQKAIIEAARMARVNGLSEPEIEDALVTGVRMAELEGKPR